MRHSAFTTLRRTTRRRSPARASWRKHYDVQALKLRSWFIAACAALTIAASASHLVHAQAGTITIVAREGRKPLPTQTINNQDYITVDDINTAFGTTSREDR